LASSARPASAAAGSEIESPTSGPDSTAHLHRDFRIRFHDQRHTHATLLLEEGATERYAAERLGDTVEMIHESFHPKIPKPLVLDLAIRLSATYVLTMPRPAPRRPTKWREGADSAP
jgi:hypothetical protein